MSNCPFHGRLLTAVLAGNGLGHDSCLSSVCLFYVLGIQLEGSYGKGKRAIIIGSTGKDKALTKSTEKKDQKITNKYYEEDVMLIKCPIPCQLTLSTIKK